MTPPPPPRRRRSLRLSLRAFLGLVAAIAIGLGSWIAAARAQRDAVAGILAIAPDAEVDYDLDPEDDDILEGVRPSHADPEDDGGLPWWVPGWAFRLLGRDYFRSATPATIVVPEDAGPGRREAIVGHLARLRHLRELSLYLPIGDADVARLAHLKELERLSLGPGPGLTGRSMGLLAGLGRLKHLDLHGAPVDDAGLARLAGHARLEFLSIEGATVTDAGVAALGRLPRLKGLWLTAPAANPAPDAGVLMTGRVPAGVGRFPALTDCRIRCRVPEGGGLALLGAMPGLGRLDLSGPTIRDADLGAVAALRRLARLRLEDATIGEAGVAHLAGLALLEVVELESPHIRDPVLPILARLPGLAELTLTRTAVTAEGLGRLRPASLLTTLRVVPEATGMRDRLARVLPKCQLNPASFH